MELLQTPFPTSSAISANQLARMLGGAGFDSARDIEASPSIAGRTAMLLLPIRYFDPDWKEEEKPWVIGRKPFGSIAIANSDARS